MSRFLEGQDRSQVTLLPEQRVPFFLVHRPANHIGWLDPLKKILTLRCTGCREQRNIGQSKQGLVATRPRDQFDAINLFNAPQKLTHHGHVVTGRLLVFDPIAEARVLCKYLDFDSWGFGCDYMFLCCPAEGKTKKCDSQTSVHGQSPVSGAQSGRNRGQSQFKLAATPDLAGHVNPPAQNFGDDVVGNV